MKRTPIRRCSPKRAARDRRYRIERVEFLERQSVCGALLPGCRWIATEVHHKAGRARSVFFDQGLWLALCSSCHGWVTEHPAEAFERGLSVRRNQSGEAA